MRACTSVAALTLALLGGRALAAPACRADGWCWLNPQPQGNDLLDVYAASPTDVWAVGDRGTIVHWDGHRWTLAEPGVPERLRAIDGRNAQDVWAVGDHGMAVHFDGKSWQAHPLPERHALGDVWVSPTGHAWTVGRGLVARWDGTGWKIERPSDAALATIWGTSDEDVWIGGEGTLSRWNGQRWSAVPPPRTPGGAPFQPRRLRGAADALFGIFAPQEGVSSDQLEAFEWTGKAWDRLPATFSAAGGIWALGDLWVPGRDDVWLQLDFSRAPVPPIHLHRAHGWWSQKLDTGPESMNPVKLGGSSESDGWAVGGCGGIAHWTGGSWHTVSVNPARMASSRPDPLAVRWLSLEGARLSTRRHELWLEGRWPPDDPRAPPTWFRVDLRSRTFAAGTHPHGIRVRGTGGKRFDNGRGERWLLRDVGSEPRSATIMTHEVAGKPPSTAAFPLLRGAFVDGDGAFWAWGDCGTLVTQGAAAISP